MISKALIALIIFVFASAILITSIFRTASVRYSFRLLPSPAPQSLLNIPDIDYQLPGAGRVNPSHFLWPLEVLRDKAWLAFTPNPLKKAQISLLIADKRLSSALLLFSNHNPALAVSVSAKAELYLLQAFDNAVKAKEQGMSVSEFLDQLSRSSLKHRAVLETIRAQAPEDAQPVISEILDTPKSVYEKSCHKLQESGCRPPDNPFE